MVSDSTDNSDFSWGLFKAFSEVYVSVVTEYTKLVADGGEGFPRASHAVATLIKVVRESEG